jgi:hypothetical protein
MHGHARRSVATIASVVGIAACLVTTVSSFWAATGTTPAWVFERFDTLHQLRSPLRVGGVPAEFFGLLMFALVVLLANLHARIPPGLRSAVIFLVAAVQTGAFAAESLDLRFGNWAINTAILASLTVLLAISAESFPRPSALWRETVAVGHAIRGSRRTVVGLVTAACVIVLFTLGLHAACRPSSRKEAATRNFLNWYSSRTPTQDTHLRPKGRIRVVAFADHLCPACATGLPRATQLVNDLAASSHVPVELVVYDFPLDAACNPGVWKTLNGSACNVAAAVRFVRGVLGAEAEREMKTWLSQRNAKLMSTEELNRYVAARGLAGRFEAARAEMLRQVSADVAYGLTLGVSVTPSFFVNGVKLPNGGYLETAIRFELGRASPTSVGDSHNGSAVQ